ncbi:MAG: hypothetical protein GWP36_08455, partial [Bacteroidetes bacterium]|nr:hypothetical protein [Bacteroidota bacterium]
MQHPVLIPVLAVTLLALGACEHSTPNISGTPASPPDTTLNSIISEVVSEFSVADIKTAETDKDDGTITDTRADIDRGANADTGTESDTATDTATKKATDTATETNITAPIQPTPQPTETANDKANDK